MRLSVRGRTRRPAIASIVLVLILAVGAGSHHVVVPAPETAAGDSGCESHCPCEGEPDAGDAVSEATDGPSQHDDAPCPPGCENCSCCSVVPSLAAVVVVAGQVGLCGTPLHLTCDEGLATGVLVRIDRPPQPALT